MITLLFLARQLLQALNAGQFAKKVIFFIGSSIKKTKANWVKLHKLLKLKTINLTNNTIIFVCSRWLDIELYFIWLDNKFMSKDFMSYSRKEKFSAIKFQLQWQSF